MDELFGFSCTLWVVNRWKTYDLLLECDFGLFSGGSPHWKFLISMMEWPVVETISGFYHVLRVFLAVSERFLLLLKGFEQFHCVFWARRTPNLEH